MGAENIIVIIGFEPLHSLRRKTRDNVGFAALKLDISKAYDRVEWLLLLGVMEKLRISLAKCKARLLNDSEILFYCQW